jgi:predicted dithiol-disulfide oxidoreductase (DUF899 family)
VGTYASLDLTARGRQEDWERPPGRGDDAAMGWLRRHDEYVPAAVEADRRDLRAAPSAPR